MSIYLQRNTVKFKKKLFKKTLCTSQRVLPKYSTLQIGVREQLTHHLHHSSTTGLDDKASNKKAQNKHHYHFKEMLEALAEQSSVRAVPHTSKSSWHTNDDIKREDSEGP